MMVIVTESMANPRNSILWVGVKLDFGSEFTVNPSVDNGFVISGCFPSTDLRRSPY